MAIGFSAERFELFLDRNAGEKKQKEIFHRFAQKKRDEALSRNQKIFGSAPEYDTYVGGRAGAAINEAEISDPIVFEFHITPGIALFAVTLLRTVSPYDPTPDGKPHYRDRHFVVVDDAVIDPPYEGVRSFNRMLILSDLPYARFLEARYGVYRDLAYPRIRREFNRSFKVAYVFDDYFGERNPAILITPKG